MTAPAGARIIEGGYRSFDGVRTGRRGAIRSVAVHTTQRALGLRRAGRYKILPVLAALLAYVPAIVYAGLAALLPPDTFLENDLLPTYAEYYFFITSAIVVFAAFVAPEVLCTDRRTGMLGLYLASPLTRYTYLASKAISVMGVLAIVTLGPPLFLLIAYVLIGTGPDGPADVGLFFVRIVAAGTLVSAFFGSMSMAVSSLTDRKAAASAAIVVMLLLSGVVTSSLVEGAEVSVRILLANLFVLPFEAVIRIFGESSEDLFFQQLGTGEVIAATIAWCLLFAGIVVVRYRALEVTR